MDIKVSCSVKVVIFTGSVVQQAPGSPFLHPLEKYAR
jgi:hypothetical protein